MSSKPTLAVVGATGVVGGALEAAALVVGVRRREAHRPPQPRQRHRDVGRAAAGPLHDRAVGGVHHVDERLTDHQHVRFHGGLSSTSPGGPVEVSPAAAPFEARVEV